MHILLRGMCKWGWDGAERALGLHCLSGAGWGLIVPGWEVFPRMHIHYYGYLLSYPY